MENKKKRCLTNVSREMACLLDDVNNDSSPNLERSGRPQHLFLLGIFLSSLTQSHNRPIHTECITANILDV